MSPNTRNHVKTELTIKVTSVHQTMKRAVVIIQVKGNTIPGCYLSLFRFYEVTEELKSNYAN